MKSKSLILELDDPYSNKITNFKRTSNSLKISDKNGNAIVKEPGRPDFKSDREAPGGPFRKATNYEVARKLDLDPENISCINDLKRNWIHYAAYGLWMGTVLAPVIRPILNVGAKTGTQLWKTGANTLTSRGQNIIKIAKQVSPFLKNLPNTKLPPLSAAAGKTLARGGRWFTAIDDFGKASGAVKLLKSPGGRFALARQAASHTGLGVFRFFNRSILVGLVLIVAYKGFGLEKFFKWGKDIDIELFSMAFTAIDTVFVMAIKYETMMAEFLLLSNENLQKDCMITNAIVSAILATYFIAPFGAGKQKALYNLEDIKNLKTGDDFAAFVKKEKGLRIDNFTKGLETALGSSAKTAGIKPQLLKKYLEIFYRNEKQALTFLQNKGIDPSVAAVFQDDVLRIFAKQEKEFIKTLSLEARGNHAVIKKAHDSDEVQQLTQIGKNLLDRSLKTFRSMKRDPRLAEKVDELGDISRAGRMVDDFKNVNNLSSFNTIEEAGKSIIQLEKALETGKISVKGAAHVWSSGLSKNVSVFSSDLSRLMKLPDDMSNLSKSQKIEKITKAFADLSKSEQEVISAINLLAPKGKLSGNLTFWQKVFNTKNAKKAKQVDSLVDARTAVYETKKQILRLNPGMKIDDLNKIDKSIEATYKALMQASGAGVTTRVGDIGSMLRQVGILSSLIVLFGWAGRKIYGGEIEDLETWQKTEIARSLAWDGYFPSAILELVYLVQKPAEWMDLTKNPDTTEARMQIQLAKIVEKILSTEVDGTGNGPVLRRLYEDIIFSGNDNLISKVAKSKEINPIKIVNELRLNKSDYSKIMFDLFVKVGITAGGEVDGGSLGQYALTGDDKYISFRKLWFPAIISILIANSGLIARLNNTINSNYYNNLKTTQEKERFLKSKVFFFANPEDIDDNLERWVQMYKKTIRKKLIYRKNNKVNEVLIMKEQKNKQNSLIRQLVNEMLTEDYGKGYTPYPYHSHIGQEGEPAEDFVQDWKDFELALVRDESRNTAIEVAKILVKDLELFGDVLDLVGKNQSVATEIMVKLKENEKT